MLFHILLQFSIRYISQEGFYINFVHIQRSGAACDRLRKDRILVIQVILNFLIAYPVKALRQIECELL